MKMLIAGQWLDKDEKIEVRNKYNGELIDTVPDADKADIQEAVQKGIQGVKTAGDFPLYKRIEMLEKAAKIIEERKEEIAKLLASEGIKTIREARREIFRGSNTFKLSAEEGRRIGGETLSFESVAGSENRTGYYYRQPIGLIAAIISFNDLFLSIYYWA